MINFIMYFIQKNTPNQHTKLQKSRYFSPKERDGSYRPFKNNKNYAIFCQ